MRARSVVRDADLEGCSETEIAELERCCGVRLPVVYRRYLRLMGRASGRLFSHDHVDVTYEDVLGINERKTQRMDAAEPDERGPLPSDAFIISERLGEQWEFIRCDGTEDPVVWWFAEWEDAVKQSHGSVLAWLTVWCEAAEEAIASGYFDRHPDGTGR